MCLFEAGVCYSSLASTRADVRFVTSHGSPLSYWVFFKAAELYKAETSLVRILCFCKQLLACRTHLEASLNRSHRKFNAFLYSQSLFEKGFQVLTMQKS
jgi:hypothetical protein